MAYWWLDACAQPDAAVAALARQRAAQRSASLANGIALLAGAQASATPQLTNVHACLFAGDHGVAPALGARGGTGAAVRAWLADAAPGAADVHREAVDLGVRDDPGEVPGLRHAVIARATADFRVHPAMSAEQALRAIAAGRASVEQAHAAGAQLIIGLTLGDAQPTSARALACRLLGITPQALCGGTVADAVAATFAVIDAGLARHVGAVDALACVRRLGGYETAALAGACIAAAQLGVPMLLEGLPGAVAAMVATGLNPDARAWVLLAQAGNEPGLARVLAALKLEPLLPANADLADRTPVGAALAALRMACCG